MCVLYQASFWLAFSALQDQTCLITLGIHHTRKRNPSLPRNVQDRGVFLTKCRQAPAPILTLDLPFMSGQAQKPKGGAVHESEHHTIWGLWGRLLSQTTNYVGHSTVSGPLPLSCCCQPKGNDRRGQVVASSDMELLPVRSIEKTPEGEKEQKVGLSRKSARPTRA